MKTETNPSDDMLTINMPAICAGLIRNCDLDISNPQDNQFVAEEFIWDASIHMLEDMLDGATGARLVAIDIALNTICTALDGL